MVRSIAVAGAGADTEVKPTARGLTSEGVALSEARVGVGAEAGMDVGAEAGMDVGAEAGVEASVDAEVDPICNLAKLTGVSKIRFAITSSIIISGLFPALPQTLRGKLWPSPYEAVWTLREPGTERDTRCESGNRTHMTH